jgi:ribosome biogenesis GTPase A
MARGVRKIRENLSQVDLVLEVRDARLPLTSINPAFEELFGTDRGLKPKNGKRRLVVYNRRDLAEPGLEEVCSFYLIKLVFTSTDIWVDVSAGTTCIIGAFWTIIPLHRLEF